MENVAELGHETIDLPANRASLPSGSAGAARP
jgi:hypothetical protein